MWQYPSVALKSTHVEPVLDVVRVDDRLADKLLKENRIALTVTEARYFQKKLDRPLTLTELTILAIQGSEHCSYRSSRRHLKNLPTKGRYVMMGPGEDAGIIEVARETGGKKWGIVIGHESHNAPSQIVPFEGAATGIGGCVRDIVCMGAKTIGVLDPLRFGDPKKPVTRYLTREVVRGIAGYGNPLGVPNLGGDLEFDPSFDVNCLVNVVALGILREDEIIHSHVPLEAAKVGYDIIVVGKATDRSGFGGAAFASAKVKEEDTESNRGAVQEPNPFLERHIICASHDLFAELKRRKLLDKVSMKDMGAGGNVCASVEQVAPRDFGAEIDLERIHVGIPDLPPHIIACSETQERFCWICHPDVTQLILDTYNKKWALPEVSQGARATVVGKVKYGNYVLKYHGATVADAPAKFFTEGLSYDRPYKRAKKIVREDKMNWSKLDLDTVLKKLVASPNIASRDSIVRRYDKQVQGATTVDAGLGGPSIIAPLTNTAAPAALKKVGAAVGIGGSGTLGAISAELQAMHAVVESVTNVVASGCTPLALTDCLNYGNPEEPDRMAELIDGISGLKKAAETLKTPFVSGNVSLYKNVNPSAIVACVGRIADYHQATPAVFQKAGNTLILIGTRDTHLGGSELLNVLGEKSGQSFMIDLPVIKRMIALMLAAHDKKLITSARDLHRGGIAIAALEMAFGGPLGVTLDTSDLPGNLWSNLFAENPGFLLEVAPQHLAALAALAQKTDVTVTTIGQTTHNAQATFVDDKKVWCDTPIKSLESLWRNGLGQILQ